ncbi:MAG: DUF697 domain-containing protein [Acaryochloridaceae cyanobacterium SU_2_1]|nr:DUF697 domain-containing protein [Acaryochloridaceae cyanobacterium SU_2_1]
MVIPINSVTPRAVDCEGIDCEAVAEKRELLERAIATLQQLLQQSQTLPLPLQSDLQNQLGILRGLEQKLQQRLIQIAAFGFVSRGKSAVLNALFAEPIFPVGPLNGETQWPRSVRWSPGHGNSDQQSALQIELIDTPGLDEIADQGRAQMAQTIAHSADLILFIVAGPPSPIEIEALQELQQAGRPLLLVVNKADLYPELNAESLYQGFVDLADPAQGSLLSVEDIVMAAAAPAPSEIWMEWPDGRRTQEWETTPPQVESLKLALLRLINQEGIDLLTLNAILQTQGIEAEIAQRIAHYYAEPSAACIRHYARLKAILLVLSPLALVDILVSVLMDLLLVGTLVKLYQLPTHRYQVGKLWQRLILSGGGLILIEWTSHAFLLSSLNFWPDWSLALLPWLGAAIAQAGMGWYGAIKVGQQTQTYLIEGRSWGPWGSSRIRQKILNGLLPHSSLYRRWQSLDTQKQTLTKN